MFVKSIFFLIVHRMPILAMLSLTRSLQDTCQLMFPNSATKKKGGRGVNPNLCDKNIPTLRAKWGPNFM